MLEFALFTLPLFSAPSSEWQTARRSTDTVLVYKAAVGTGTRPILSIECRGRMTSLTVYWPQWVSRPVAQRVTYAIDYEPPRAEYWHRTTDARSVGLWERPSISLSKRLIGKSQLVVYARTKTNEIMHARFMLSGLDRAIGPVEQACRWPGSTAHSLALRSGAAMRGRQSAAP